MKQQEIEGKTRDMGKPQGWNEATQGPCDTLPIRDESVQGLQMMVSEWKPTPEELKKLIAGASIFLAINGHNHPVIMLWTGEP